MLVHINVYRRAGDAKKVIRTSPQHSPLCGEPNCQTATKKRISTLKKNQTPPLPIQRAIEGAFKF